MGTQEAASSIGIDPGQLAAMLDAERATWTAERPNAVKFHERAKRSQLNGVPTSRVRNFPPVPPVVLERAKGSRVWDTDRPLFADFHLSGSAALFGHSHPKIVAALKEQADRQYRQRLALRGPGRGHRGDAAACRSGDSTSRPRTPNRFALRLARASPPPPAPFPGVEQDLSRIARRDACGADAGRRRRSERRLAQERLRRRARSRPASCNSTTLKAPKRPSQRRMLPPSSSSRQSPRKARS